jgi:hypothetical protein
MAKKKSAAVDTRKFSRLVVDGIKSGSPRPGAI